MVTQMEPEEAIRRHLHVGGFVTPLRSPGYRKPRAVTEDGSVVVRDSDCEPERSEETWTRAEWDEAVRRGGLWRSVGLWSFVPADDPAGDCIRTAESSPHFAGRLLHEARERERRLREWVLPLYEATMEKVYEAAVRLEVMYDQGNDIPSDRDELAFAALRRDRVRRWITVD